MIGAVVTLEEGEQEVARLIASARTRHNREAGVVNDLRSDESKDSVELDGFGAELAFCKLFNSYPDLTTFIRSSMRGEDVGDAQVGTARVDVKQTAYPQGKLLVLPWKNDPVQYYALMVGSFPTYTYKGAISKEEALQPSRLGNLGRGECYIVTQAELQDIL